MPPEPPNMCYLQPCMCSPKKSWFQSWCPQHILEFMLQCITQIYSFVNQTLPYEQRIGYNVHCRHLTQAEYFSMVYGFNRRFALNNSRYYHVGGLPVDAMHDVLEGVLQYHTKELLKFYILEQKTFTLDELNNRIASFDNG